MKKNLKFKEGIALAVLAGFGLVWGEAVQCSADPTKMCEELDIIVRDFPVTHPDFENFQEEYFTSANYAGRCAWATDQTSIPSGCSDIVGATNTWIASFTTADLTWGERRLDYATWGCGNTQTPQYGIHVGTDGYAKFDNATIPSGLPYYLQTKVSTAGYTWYGEFEGCTQHPTLNPKGLSTMRGFVHELCVPEATTSSWTLDMIDYSGSAGTKAKFHNKYNGKNEGACDAGFVCKGHAWSQAVSVTHNMVSTYLTFDPNLGEDMMYEPIISRSPTRPKACDNSHFEQWYADIDPTTGVNLQEANINKRVNTVLQLPRVDGTTNVYEIDYNRNNGGYFPLDMVDENENRVVVPNVGYAFPTGTENQFGPQSLSIFCPPYDYAYRDNQTDYQGNSTAALCEAWKSAGGPKSSDAAFNASTAMGTYKYLRNYGFTMMGYAKFKYKKNGQEVFEFAGDDDMWIYVDGVLAVDLGGTHLAAPGKVEMDFLSQNSHGCHEGEPLANNKGEGENCSLEADGSWKDGTWHHLHFFYADRQTDGSNMKIHSTLSELAKSRYGQPAIGRAVVTIDEKGNQNVSMLLNTSLDQNTLAQLQNSGEPAILIVREVENGDGTKSKVVYGFYVTSVAESQNNTDAGVQYDFTGTLRDLENNEVASGIMANDLVAFNFQKTSDLVSDEETAAVYAEIWSQLLAWSDKMHYTVTSSSNKGVIGPPSDYEDWAKTKLVAVTKIASFTLDTLIERPDFTAQSNVLTQIADNNSGELPLNYTADLLISSVPAGKGRNGNPLDLTPDEKRDLSAAAPEGSSTGNQTIAFVGGNPNGSAGMCYGNGDGTNESCTSISYPVAGPFRLNVRVFDHLGHFVSQYQQVVTEDMLHKALREETHPGSCSKPLYGATGAAWITVKMYPVSQNGRLLATGPYIYQVTFVQEEYSHCLVRNDNPQDNNLPYDRSNDTYRFGYKRSKHK